MTDKSIFEDFTNLYSVTKTLRFGLTPNNSKLRTKSSFDELITHSIKSIQNQLNTKPSLNEELVVHKLKNILDKSATQIEAWYGIKHRGDSLHLSKEYYQKLSYKGNFTAFTELSQWNKRENKYIKLKTPAVKNSYLGLNYLGENNKLNRKDIINNIWENYINRFSSLSHQMLPSLNQYTQALQNPNSAHTKPNLIEFKKLSLSICNTVKAILDPLVTGDIIIQKLDKLHKSDENTKLKEFFGTENISNLHILIEEIKSIQNYYDKNGALVPLGRASFNYNTALQKPENYKNEIDEIIKTLDIKTILQKYKNYDDRELAEALKFNINNKINIFLNNPNGLTLLEQAQLFKPKPIPFATKTKLADYLCKNAEYSYDKVYRILDSFGTSVDIAKDYQKLENKNDLDLNSYPIKLAFDYTWENLARNTTGLVPDLQFAKSQSIVFLEQFGVDTKHQDFILYSNLLFIGDKLAVLEHQSEIMYDQNEVKNIISQLD